MGATDQMLARYVAEIEERQQFIDGIVEAADGKDLSDEQAELVTETRNRIEKVNTMMKPLEEARRITGDSHRADRRAREVHEQRARRRRARSSTAPPASTSTTSGGRRLGQTEAKERLEIFHRAAAHQTTTDNPGLLPEQIMGPVVNWVDQARPLVSALGPRNLPSGS